jgi:hypothetical protein
LRFRRFAFAAYGVELNASGQLGTLAGLLPGQVDKGSFAAHLAPFISLRIVSSLRARFLIGPRYDRLPSSRSLYTGAGATTESLPGSNAWGLYMAVAAEWQPGLLLPLPTETDSAWQSEEDAAKEPETTAPGSVDPAAAPQPPNVDGEDRSGESRQPAEPASGSGPQPSNDEATPGGGQ